MRYLYSVQELNLTPPTNVTHGSNWIITIELAAPPKLPALAYLEAVDAALGYAIATFKQGSWFNASASQNILAKLAALPGLPPRRAAVLIAGGAGKPPKVYQVNPHQYLVVLLYMYGSGDHSHC